MSQFVHGLDSSPATVARLGELGSGLIDLQRYDLAVPRGFVVTTQAHRVAATSAEEMPAEVWEDVAVALMDLREPSSRANGAADTSVSIPAVAVRPSPPPHMRGVLPSFAGLGLDEPLPADPAGSDDADARWRSRERLLRQWARWVHRIDVGAIDDAVAKGGGPQERASALEDLLWKTCEAVLPVEPVDQIRQAISAIWRAWDAPEASRRRELTGIPEDAGTGVVVQLLVGSQASSGRGRVFTREPTTGSPEPVASFLTGSYAHTGAEKQARLSSLRQALPAELFGQLAGAIPLLEAGWRDLCEISFVVESDRLWFVGIRQAERSSAAAVRVAVDMAHEGLIAAEEALARVPLSALLRLQAPVIARGQAKQPSEEQLKLVPAQPDIHTAQLLDWCDERRRLKVVQSPPSGWTTVSAAEEIASTRASQVLFDMDALQSDMRALREALRAATHADVVELGVQLADIPDGADLTLPAGPWTLIVGGPTRSWAARLLGARPTLPASPSGSALSLLDQT
jgi:pyruvate, orthophosphate dikinase